MGRKNKDIVKRARKNSQTGQNQKEKKKKKNKVIEEGFPYIVFPNMGYKKSCKAKEPKEIKKLY